MGLFDNFGQTGPHDKTSLLGKIGNAAHRLDNDPGWQEIQARERGENPFDNAFKRAQIEAFKTQQTDSAAKAQARAAALSKIEAGTKVSPAEMIRAGISPSEHKMLMPGSGTQSPSAVREYEYYNSLNEADKKQFLAVKRAQTIKDFGGYHGSVSSDGTVQNVGDKTLKPEQDLGYIKDAATSRVAGTDLGEAQVAVTADLAKGKEARDLISKAIAHPGREAATGMSSIFNSAAIPGGDRKDFLVLGQQLRGKNFLDAYQGLKGGGQITEIEGAKAEQAQARLNEAQSEDEYLVALREMDMLIAERMDRIRSKAGVTNDGWSIVED